MIETVSFPPDHIAFDASMLEQDAGTLLGFADESTPVIWRPVDAPSLLLCGPAGSGKSVASRLLQIAALRDGWDLWVADPRTHESSGLRRRCGVRVATGDTGMQPIWDLLNDAAALAQERRTQGAPDRDVSRRVMVFVDEVDIVWRTHEGATGEHARAVRSFADVRDRGGEVGVHLVGSLQRSDRGAADGFAQRLLLGGPAARAFDSHRAESPTPSTARGLGRFAQDDEPAGFLRVPFMSAGQFDDLLDRYAPRLPF